MPEGELCFNVSAGAPEHEKLTAAGGDAGWLWICLLAYCKRNKKDGVFAANVVPRVSDRRQPMKLLARLCREHLAHEPGHDCKDCAQPMPGYYVLHDWPYWQGTVAAEMEARERDQAAREAKGSGGSYGNHRRWHTGQGRADSSCEWCALSHMRSDMRSDTDQLSDHITDQSSDRYAIGMRVADAMASDNGTPSPPQTPPHPRVEITPPTPPAGAGRKSRQKAYNYAADQAFLRFWDAFPQKSGKPSAFEAWQKALARDADPEFIITAARRYRNDPRRNPAHTKYPQGWLNDERYNDYAEGSQETLGGDEEYWQ